MENVESAYISDNLLINSDGGYLLRGLNMYESIISSNTFFNGGSGRSVYIGGYSGSANLICDNIFRGGTDQIYLESSSIYNRVDNNTGNESLSVAVTDRGTNNVSGRALFDDGKRLALGSGTYTGMAIMSLSTSSISTIDTLNLHNESAGENTEGGTKLTFSGYGPTNGQGDWRFAGIAGVYDTTSNGLRAGDWGGKLKFFVNRGSSATDFEDAMTITGGGNIAIGKTSASTRLDVSGSVFVTGSLNVSSGITGSLFGTASYAITANTPSTIWIPASAWIPRTTSGSGINSLETTTNKINYDVLQFDAGTIEYAQAMTTMPSNWNLGNISANFYWTATGSSGAVVWRIAARSFADDNLIDALMGTAQSVTDTFITGSDMHISANTPAVTITGSNSTTNAVVYEISRNASDGADTLAVDAQLLGVKINFNI
jgi:hypothetical protein